MKGWIKIIETKEHDILIQRLSDNDDLEHVKITLNFKGVVMSFTLGFKDSIEKADNAFNVVSIDNIDGIIESATGMDLVGLNQIDEEE